jgi:hypothetical protein
VFDHAIDLREMREKPQIVWFDLPATLQRDTARLIGNLVLAISRVDALLRQSRGGHSLQQYVFVDEFAILAGPTIETMIQQARSMKLALVLANQSMSDLKQAAYDLIPCLEENVRFRRFFTATDRIQRDALMDASGDTIDYVFGWRSDDRGSSESITETLRHRIDRNDVIRVSDDPFLSIASLPRGAGYAQMGGFPFILRGQYHIPAELFADRDKRPWPEPSPEYPGAYLPDQRTTSTGATLVPRSSRQIESEPSDSETQAVMRRLIEQQQSKRDSQHKRSTGKQTRRRPNN